MPTFKCLHAGTVNGKDLSQSCAMSGHLIYVDDAFLSDFNNREVMTKYEMDNRQYPLNSILNNYPEEFVTKGK